MWYSKYLTVFDRPVKEFPQHVIQEIADKINDINQRLAHEEPLCSVVAIAHNEESHILGCLWSLTDNICPFPIEIIVVNNNSTDATEQLLKRVGVTYYNEHRQSPGHARQCGLDAARGKYHVCIDSDTLYPPHYIATHVKHLAHGAVCTYGLWSFIHDDKHSRLGLVLYESFRDIYLSFQNLKRPELVVRGMVLAFDTEAGRKVGYRTHIKRGEDGMMALGLKQYGRLKMLRSRKVRAVTCNSTLDSKGNLMANAWLRAKKAVKNLSLLFTSQAEYKDQDYNIIKPNADDSSTKQDKPKE